MEIFVKEASRLGIMICCVAVILNEEVEKNILLGKMCTFCVGV